MAQRVTSTRFVGREAELAELLGLLARARDGRAHIAVVTGESGLGKTRLVDELAVRARKEGARVLSGECVELGESELPYAPIVSALRPLVRARDPVLSELGAGRFELAQLLPELGDGGPGMMDLTSTGAGTPSPQSRLFETLLGLLDRLSAEQPVVLVVEDAHWADRSTRDFLVFLSRALCRERVLVLVTYRSDELHRRHPMRPVMAELERTERAVPIRLQPFTRAELVAQLEDIVGAPPDPCLIDRIFARSEGNPLYVEELVAAGRDGRGEVPPTLRDALMLRVEALSEEAQELLRVVAAGQRVDHGLLRAVSGLDGRPLRDALREAVAQQLLEVDEEGRYTFRHALLREAVHDDLLPGEQTELHTQLAQELERLVAAGAPLVTRTEIAHHWIAAGDRERALGACVAAAEAAERVHANGEAAAMLERALELWERVREPEALAGTDHVDLLGRAAIAHGRSEDHNRMRTLLRRALDEVDRDAEPRRAALLLERTGSAQWQLGKSDAAMASYDAALDLLPAHRPCPERAVVLAAQGAAQMLAGRYDAGAGRCREAIAVAREVGARGPEAHALNTLGVCLASLGDVEGGERALREAMEIAREGARPEALVRAYTNLAEVLYLAGHAREARDLSYEGLREIDDKAECRWLALQSVDIEFHLGDWDAAEALADAHQPTQHGLIRVLWLVGKAPVALGRGDHRAAIRMLEEAKDLAQRSIEPQWHAPIAALLAQAYRRDRRFDDARAAVEEGLRRVPPGRNQDLLRIARITSAGVAVEADRAEHARALGRSEEAEEAVARARELLQVCRQAGAPGEGAPRPAAHAHLTDAEANALRAEGRPDPEVYAAAALEWEALERPYTAALARRRQAEALAARGDREGAAAVCARAREVAERVGARWLVEELDLLARRARLPTGDDASAAPDADGFSSAPFEELGLTPREREVLELLAQGRTNREIGETLYMAEKTASVHVSRILAKLEVRTRTEAAAVAHRLGLAA